MCTVFSKMAAKLKYKRTSITTKREQYPMLNTFLIPLPYQWSLYSTVLGRLWSQQCIQTLNVSSDHTSKNIYISTSSTRAPQDKHISAGNWTRITCVKGEYSSKELFYQLMLLLFGTSTHPLFKSFLNQENLIVFLSRVNYAVFCTTDLIHLVIIVFFIEVIGWGLS